MPLTSQQIKNVKPDVTRTQKLFDGHGLFLEVTPKGSKRWRLKYRFAGKEKLISLGLFPLIGLKEARDKRDDARRMVANGVDPSAQRQAVRDAAIAHDLHNFEAIAREWLAQKRNIWATSHTRTTTLRLEKNVFPFIGKKPIAEISAPDLLGLLRRIEARDAIETAHRVRTNLGEVFRYAIATGRAQSDPARDLKGALRPVKTTHLAAVTDPKRVGEILRIMDGHRGGPIVAAALRLAPLVFVRPGELRNAAWADINLETAEWRFTVRKTNTAHIVPLSRQAVDVLNTIYPLTGNGRFVFPSPRTPLRPLSDNGVLAALRGLGIPKEEMCGHGFRAMARTILDEVLGFQPHLIEHQLAHAVRDSLGRAYNRTKHLPERTVMMQKWADYLDCLKAGEINVRK
jgi:integrase